MATTTTTSQLDRIAALVDLLAPLGGKQRGMRIEADEWNAIVQALRGILEIDEVQERATQLSLASAYAPRVHEHLGQVSLAWLDVDLQDRIGQGSGSLSVRSALTEIGRRADAAGSEVARLTTALEQQQRRSDDQAVQQLDHGSALRGFEERFGGVEDMRGLVTTLSKQVVDLEPAVSSVLELRGSLTDVSGAPIDVRALQADTAALHATVDAALAGVDGTPARLRDMQLQLRELQDAAGTGGPGGLDGRIAGAVGPQVATAADSLRAELATATDQRVATAADELRAELGHLGDDVLAKVDDHVKSVLEERLKAVDDDVVILVQRSLDAQLNDRVSALVVQATDDRIAALRSDFSTSLDRVRTQLTTRFSTIEGRITHLGG